MIFAITRFVKFKVDEERERLNHCFTDTTLDRQLRVFQLFLDGKYEDCYNAIALLPYDSEKECDEAEYVSPFIFDTVCSLQEHSNIRVEQIHESESTSQAED